MNVKTVRLNQILDQIRKLSEEAEEIVKSFDVTVEEEKEDDVTVETPVVSVPKLNDDVVVVLKSLANNPKIDKRLVDNFAAYFAVENSYTGDEVKKMIGELWQACNGNQVWMAKVVWDCYYKHIHSLIPITSNEVPETIIFPLIQVSM